MGCGCCAISLSGDELRGQKVRAVEVIHPDAVLTEADVANSGVVQVEPMRMFFRHRDVE